MGRRNLGFAWIIAAAVSTLCSAGCSTQTNSGFTPIVVADAPTSGGTGDISAQEVTDTDAVDADAISTDSMGTAATSPDTASPDTANADAMSADAALLDQVSSSPDGTTTDDSSAPVDSGDAAGADAETIPPTGKPCAFDASVGAKPSICPVGQVCVGSVGSCTGWVSGVCKPAVLTCPALAQPVCGCDGKTYNNPCEAQKAQVVIKLTGSCGGGAGTCGGPTAKPCPGGQLCDVAGCATSDVGICVATPAAGSCPNGGPEECGCDNNTYPNACYRQLAKVGRKNKGACAPDPTTVPCKIGPIKPPLCPTGTYCQVYDTNPIDCVGSGECVKLPVVCDASTTPVCGCDGKTYSNPCLLAQAKQNQKSAGACGSNICTEGQPGCSATTYCGVPQGQCGSQGVCINKPPATTCTGVLDPVCGCDGKTYTNASCAAVQGVVVKAKGSCGP